MSERRKNLEETLSAVEAHLAGEQTVSEEISRPLQTSVTQLRQTLSEATPGEHRAVAQRLREVALRAEASHPELASLVLHLCDLLSGAGV